MSSEELSITQTMLEEMVIELIKAPDTNYDEVDKLLTVIQLVDTKRRNVWNEEKFGAYEEIADAIFDSDDIPF